MNSLRQNWAAWVLVLVTLGAYAVATAQTVAQQGQRITNLEQLCQADREERQRQMRQLDRIATDLAAMRAEQAILHGKSAAWRGAN